MPKPEHLVATRFAQEARWITREGVNMDEIRAEVANGKRGMVTERYGQLFLCYSWPMKTVGPTHAPPIGSEEPTRASA